MYSWCFADSSSSPFKSRSSICGCMCEINHVPAQHFCQIFYFWMIISYTWLVHWIRSFPGEQASPPPRVMLLPPGTQSRLCLCSGRLPRFWKTWWDITLTAALLDPKSGSRVTTNPSNTPGESWSGRAKSNVTQRECGFHVGENTSNKTKRLNAICHLSGLWCTAWSQERPTCFVSKLSMSLASARSLRSPLPSPWSQRSVRAAPLYYFKSKWMVYSTVIQACVECGSLYDSAGRGVEYGM